MTLIWVSLERSFPPAEVEYRWCQFWSRVMTSEEEERPRLVTGGYGRHRRQWVKGKKAEKVAMIKAHIGMLLYDSMECQQPRQPPAKKCAVTSNVITF